MKYALMVNYDYASGNDSDWVYVNAAGMESSMPKMYEDFDSAYQAATVWMQQNKGQSKVVEYLSE